MRYLGGHLGTAASALVDGQLDPASAERAWTHVQGCHACRCQVEREGWIKTQLATMARDEPPDRLIGSLYGLGAGAPDGSGDRDGAAAWAAVQELERRGRGKRRTGIALVGAGSVSVAVLGLASLSGTTLGIGSTPTTTPSAGSVTPSTSLTSGITGATTGTVSLAPSARVQGRLPGGAPGR